MIRIKKTLLILPLCISFVGQSMMSYGADDFNLQWVAAGIYVHIGQHVGLDHDAHDDIANIGFIIGGRCVAVIDTGGSVIIGKKLLASIRQITDKPICYIINTHVHFDHILGNKVFLPEQPDFVGHKKLADAVVQNAPFFLENFSTNLGQHPVFEDIIGPSLLVSEAKPKVLDLGDRSLVLMAYQVAHSHADITVFDNQTKTLWTGDLLFYERIPVLTGSLKGWLKVMADWTRLDVVKTIPGHGQVVDHLPDALAAQRRYLQSLLIETRDIINQGGFLEEALNVVGRAEAQKWLLYDEQHRSNIGRAFIELEWE